MWCWGSTATASGTCWACGRAPAAKGQGLDGHLGRAAQPRCREHVHRGLRQAQGPAQHDYRDLAPGQRPAARCTWSALACGTPPRSTGASSLRTCGPICIAPTEAAARQRFAEFEAAWGQQYPAIIRLGRGAELAGPVVPDGVDPDDRAALGQLDRPGNDGHVDGLTDLAAAGFGGRCLAKLTTSAPLASRVTLSPAVASRQAGPPGPVAPGRPGRGRTAARGWRPLPRRAGCRPGPRLPRLRRAPRRRTLRPRRRTRAREVVPRALTHRETLARRLVAGARR
jgi:hypothetical protein